MIVPEVDEEEFATATEKLLESPSKECRRCHMQFFEREFQTDCPACGELGSDDQYEHLMKSWFPPLRVREAEAVEHTVAHARDLTWSSGGNARTLNRMLSYIQSQTRWIENNEEQQCREFYQWDARKTKNGGIEI